MATLDTPKINRLQASPSPGRDSMLLNLSGAHGPFFTRNLLVLTDSAGRTGVGEVPGGEKIRQTLEDAAPLVVGQPSARTRRCCSGAAALCRPRQRRPRAADLRPAHHHPRRHRHRIGAARPAGPAPGRAGGRAAGRRPAARRGGDAGLPVLRGRPRKTDLPYAASPTRPTTGSACATRWR
jgi:hypothetical protein